MAIHGSGKEGLSSSDANKRKRSNADPDTPWAKTGVIATVIGTILTFISVAFALHWLPFDSPAPPSVVSGPSSAQSDAARYSTNSSSQTPPKPLNPTTGQVKAALLTTSDLTGIDANLIAEDVEPPKPSTCPDDSFNRTVAVTRQFVDGGTLTLSESIEAYTTTAAAHAAFNAWAAHMTCGIFSPYSSSDISGQLQFGDDSHAITATWVNPSGVTVSQYISIVRSGSYLLSFLVSTPQGSSFDKISTMGTTMELAMPKLTSI